MLKNHEIFIYLSLIECDCTGSASTVGKIFYDQDEIEAYHRQGMEAAAAGESGRRLETAGPAVVPSGHRLEIAAAAAGAGRSGQRLEIVAAAAGGSGQRRETVAAAG